MKQPRSYLSLVLLVAFSVLLPSVSRTLAQSAPPDPQGADASVQPPQTQDLPLTKETVSTAIEKNEVPRIAISNTDIHVTWKSGTSVGHSRTAYSQRPENGSAWPQQETIGGNSNGTYQTSSVAVSPVDNSVHLIWVDTSNGGDGRVFYSRRQSDGTWTPQMQISRTGRFAHYPHLTVDTHGFIWAVWSAEEPSGNDNVYYRYSINNGASWLPSGDGLIDDQNAKRPWIAADRNGGVHVVWWRYEGGVWYGRWNGNSFSKEGIPSGGFNADPSVTVDSRNQIHIAWRRQNGFAKWDIYYATKTVGAGSHDWQIDRLYSGGNIDKTVVIYADNADTLHLAWYDTVRGNEVWYSRKEFGGSWLSPPIDVSNDGLYNTNADVVGRTNSDGERAHVVFESWFGGDSDVRIQHVLVGTVVPPASARPVIRGQQLPNGLKGTNNPTLTVDFTDISGGADQVRYHFGSLPTNNDPWVTLGTRTVNSGADASSCAVKTLYTQVRNSTTGRIQETPASDTIMIDQQVQALAPIRSPNAARVGDYNYIRTPSYVYNVVNEPAPCAGVSSYHSLDGSPADPTHPGGDGSIHTITLSTQGWQTEGSGFAERDVLGRVTVTDRLGNTEVFRQTLHYDDDPPQVTGGSVSATNESGASAIATINLSGVTVTDDSYGNEPGVPNNKEYWGVWVLVSGRDLGTPTQADFDGKGVIVRVPHGQASADVSLIGQGIAASGKTMKDAGPRYIYVRFFDGAGNASTTLKSTQLTLNAGYATPKVYLPFIESN